MTDAVNRSSNPLILIAALALFLIGGWFASSYFSRPAALAEAPLMSPAGCDITRQSCTVKQGDIAITLDIDAEQVRSMMPLNYRVKVEGADVQAVMLDMQGVDMFMGLNQTQLKPSTELPGWYTGSGELGVCTTGEMTWRATVTVNTSAGPVQTGFEFRAQ